MHDSLNGSSCCAQAQLDSMREKASAKEAQLLDDLATMKQLLEQEQVARCVVPRNNHTNFT